MKAPERQTAADAAEATLYDAIVMGDLPPGTPLRLRDLAEQLGMSPMPVREAVRRLESLGLVELHPHRGAWVRSMSLDDLEDTYFTRMHLEALALRAGAANFDDDDAALARAALDELQAARARDDRIGARNAHERFHFALYGASRSLWLQRSLAPAWRNSERYRVQSMRDPAHLQARAREHAQMLQAMVEHRGADAVALLFTHLRSSMELVAAQLPSGEGHGPSIPAAEELQRL